MYSTLELWSLRFDLHYESSILIVVRRVRFVFRKANNILVDLFVLTSAKLVVELRWVRFDFRKALYILGVSVLTSAKCVSRVVELRKSRFNLL